MRNTDYQFVDTDSAGIEAKLISAYEHITRRTLNPADPDRLFIAWVTDVIVQSRITQNYTGNQNIPSRAEGANLDALGKWIYDIERLSAQVSKCTLRITIRENQPSAVIIPSGTRVTDGSGALVWYTTADAVINIGETEAEVMVQCESVGSAGNGYAPGQINTLIDVDNIPYFESCSNIDTSNGGAEEANDEEYYDLMRHGLDAYSTAGPKGAYEYWAKSVSSSIADVKVIQPKETKQKLLPVYTSQDGIHTVFIGGEYLEESTLKIYAEGSEDPAVLGTDYTYVYSDALMVVSIKSDGALADASKLVISIDQIKAGFVYLYALMDDGTLADSVVKGAIIDACNGDTTRPLTDVVSCEDAEVVPYDIQFTYYVQRGTEKSLSDIQTAVQNAVGEYIAWQHAKIGRDINPSKLEWLLKETGVKRVVITSPTFTQLRNGDDHTQPQVARNEACTVINGGFEDE